MKILFILTYYRPHVSGLTIYVERLAKALAEHGHTVTVLTSHYTQDLPNEEQMDGVRVVRVPRSLPLQQGRRDADFFGHRVARDSPPRRGKHPPAAG